MTDPPTAIETCCFADDGATPNHPRHPVILLRGTPAAQAEDPAAWFESRFASHGWGASWRWGVYDYHHFHPDNHEVLGVSRGAATLLLGGEKGQEFHVSVGDVIILPAGTGHKCLRSSPDFQVVGAYPNSREPTLIRSGETPLPALRQRIPAVPLPPEDPVYGKEGPLCQHWQASP
jgi:uncharacterized protein YjlB